MTSKLSYHRLGVVLLGLVAGAAKALGCGGVPEGTIYHGEFIQTCEDDGPCGLVLEARCVGMLCACPTPGDAICLGGPTGDQWVCRPRYECHDPEPAGATGGSGGAGGGMGGSAGEGESVPMSECGAPSDCPQPPDPRCGFATCEDGQCGLVFTPGPIASQKAGDCKQAICDLAGVVVEEEDLSDYYEDGAECTFDLCIDGQAQSVTIASLVGPGSIIVCPDTGEGYCSESKCVQCLEHDHCKPGDICILERCIPPTCANNMKDGAAESDVDCGGVCLPCASGNGCLDGSDCISNVCKDFQCQLPTCDDKEKNDGEADTDCGEVCKNPPKICGEGQGCKSAADCKSNVCWAGACQAPTCSDGVQNQGEAGIDCGEPCNTDC